MKKLFLLSMILALSVASFAQSRTLSADRVIVYDSIYVNGSWIRKSDIDSWNTGTGGSAIGVDTMYVSGDTLYYKKSGNTYFNVLPSSGGGTSFIIGVSPDQQLPNTASSTHIGGVAFFTDGSISNYAWTQIDGTPTGTLDSASKAFTTVSGLQPGVTYHYKLTATNNLGATKYATLSVSIDSILLKPDEYWINDSVIVNMTPLAQSIPGYLEMVGDPSQNVVTATASNGWTFSTMGTDTSQWNPSPLLSDKSGVTAGMLHPTPADAYGYQRFDSAALKTGFINSSSQHVPGTYNFKISGLNPDDLYQIHLIGSMSFTDSTSQGMFNSRTYFATSTGQSASLNTQFRTSKNIVFDTVHPDASGVIKLAITGQDTTADKGSVGMLSALELYEISKDSSSGSAKTQLYKHYYDTTLMINDGDVTRLVIVYKPYNYDPSRSYPVLFYLDGQEDAIKDEWDPQMLTGDGIGLVAEHEKGKMYGINANGDTCSFFIIIAQTLNSEWSLGTSQIDSIYNTFRRTTASVYNTNDTLLLAGFSSGGTAAERYLYKYAYKVKGAFIASPAPGGAEALPSSATLRDTSAMFDDYGIHVFLTSRDDGFDNNIDSMKKYIDLADPSNEYYRYWGNKDHSGFVYEYQMGFHDIKYPQSIYDFFFNPTQNHRKMAFFSFHAANSAQLKYWVPVNNGGFVTPNSRILTGTDATTGWSISTVATSGWNGIKSANDAEEVPNYLMYATSYVQNASLIYKTGGSYAANGNNLLISGLSPDTTYLVYLGGSLDSSAEGGKVYTLFTAEGSTTATASYENTGDPNSTQLAKLQVKAASDGTIKIGVYPDADKTEVPEGALNRVIVRTLYNDTTHAVIPDAEDVPVNDRILIDLGGSGAGATSTTSPQGDGRYWTTLDAPGGNPTYDNIVDTSGTRIAMTLTTSGSFYNTSGVNTAGGNPSAVGQYPASATIDSWLAYSSMSPESIIVTLSAGTYTIKFWGARAASGTLTAGVKLSGDASYTTYNASNNSDYDNGAVLTVTSDGTTPITINLDASGSSNNFGYYGVIDITRTE